MVRHHTLGNNGEADLSPVRSWVLDRVGHQPTSWARAFANFRERRKDEVRRILLLRTPVNKPEVRFLTNLAHSPGYLLASTENFEDHSA